MVNYTVDFSTVRFFPYFSKFFVVFDFKKFFQEKNFEKKKTENFDEKNFREKILRKKFKMENQRKKLESKKFFEKKLGNREPSREKKFCEKKTQTWGAPPRLPARRRTSGMVHHGEVVRVVRKSSSSGAVHCRLKILPASAYLPCRNLSGPTSAWILAISSSMTRASSSGVARSQSRPATPLGTARPRGR